MLVDLRPFDITGKELEKRLDEVRITVNKNTIPQRPAEPLVTSGIRIGTPAVTSRGFGTEDMAVIAEYIKRTAADFDNSADEVRAGVAELCRKHPFTKNKRRGTRKNGGG